jgi:uncharacterized protein (TIGR00730 family)
MAQSNDRNFFAVSRQIPDEMRDSHRAMADLWQGIAAFQGIENLVTVYGSARFKEGHPYYELARSMGAALARHGFAVMTGGGPGVMEAANRGAHEAGGLSLGCNIILPFEQKLNPFVHRKVEFEFFFTRKVILRKNSLAYVLMPGGFGTMDEIFEVLTLIQTGKLPPRPVVCMGTGYWRGLGQFLHDTMLAEGTISPQDLELYTVTDDPEEGVAYIKARLAEKPSGGAESADAT